MFDASRIAFNERSAAPLLSILLLVIIMAWLFSSTDLVELNRENAPAGQVLYLFSKLTAIFVYILMWWQIMLGVLKKVSTKHHALLGMSVFTLILTHVILFISAVSSRQEALNLSMLTPDFTNGYYNSGLSLGVIALLLIIITTITGLLRHKLQNIWKIGHAFVYIAFAAATVHGLMVGSSGVLSYIVYGAVFSLIPAFVYTRAKVLMLLKC